MKLTSKSQGPERRSKSRGEYHEDASFTWDGIDQGEESDSDSLADTMPARILTLDDNADVTDDDDGFDPYNSTRLKINKR